MGSQFYSSKIRFISFLAILSVALGHCDGAAAFVNVKPFLSQWHVPWFFIMSGCFLYGSLNRHAVSVLLVKKVNALLIPYLMWCAIAAVLIVPSGDDVGWRDYFGVATPFPVCNRHLWYLHVLIVFHFVSILLWTFACRVVTRLMSRKILFFVLYCVFYSLSIVCCASTLYGTPTSPFFFLAGFLVSKYVQGDCIQLSRRGKILMTIFFGFVFIVFRGVLFFEMSPGLLAPVFRVVAIVAQILFLWFGYDLIITKPMDIPWIITPVFFVYCSHGLILAWLRNSIWPNVRSVGEMMCLFTSCVSLSILLAAAMRRVTPSLYGLLTGGRS